jgi:hypothetical protein
MCDPYILLKSLLSITCSGYKKFYAPLYPNLKNCIEKTAQDLNSEIKTKRLTTIWEHGIQMLKIRRGYLLPFDADAETCYREQEIWSYAVFTAALIHSLKKHFDVPANDLTKTLFPTDGWKWLNTHPAIFIAWNAYLQENDKNTVFHILAKQLRRSRKAKVAFKNTSADFSTSTPLT